jgi:hypothetical protein
MSGCHWYLAIFLIFFWVPKVVICTKHFLGGGMNRFFLGTFSEKKIVLASGKDCRREGERGTKGREKKIRKKFTARAVVRSAHHTTVRVVHVWSRVVSLITPSPCPFHFYHFHILHIRCMSWCAITTRRRCTITEY